MKSILIALWCMVIAPNVIAQTKTVRFAIGEWAPYTSSKENPREKIAEQIIIQAFKSQGYDVILSYYPWSRSLRLAKQGKYDGTFPWMFNDERAKDFLYSEELYTQKVVFFSHIDARFHWQNLDDIKRFRIGATQDYQATYLLNNAGIETTIENTELDNFEKLVKQRIDAYPTGLIRGKYLIEHHFNHEQASKIIIGTKPLVEDTMHILFSQQNPQRSEQLNSVFSKGLKHLFSTGEYNQIVFDSNRLNSPK